MLEIFRQFAGEKYTFAYGYKDQTAITVEKTTNWPMLYVEGYGEGKKSFDRNGKLNTQYAITFWVFQKKAYTVGAEEHSKELLILESVGDKLLRYLSENGKVGEAEFAKVINVKISATQLDGVRYQFVVTPEIQRPVCS